MNRPVPTVGGFGRRLLIALVILAVLIVGADFGVRLWAQRWFAGIVQESLVLSEEPQLHLDGFPFLLRLAEGRFPSATLESEDIVFEDLRVIRIRIEGRDVRFSFRDLFRGGDDAVVRVDRGSGNLKIDDRAISEYLQAREFPVTVEFVGPEVRTSTTVSVGDQNTTATATGRLRLANGSLLFTPETVEVEGDIGIPPDALAFEVPIPPLFEGAAYDRLVVGQGTATLEFTLTEATIPVET